MPKATISKVVVTPLNISEERTATGEMTKAEMVEPNDSCETTPLGVIVTAPGETTAAPIWLLSGTLNAAIPRAEEEIPKLSNERTPTGETNVADVTIPMNSPETMPFGEIVATPGERTCAPNFSVEKMPAGETV